MKPRRKLRKRRQLSRRKPKRAISLARFRGRLPELFDHLRSTRRRDRDGRDLDPRPDRTICMMDFDEW